jgi:hypothetical protein
MTGNPKSALCVTRVTATLCVNVRNVPRVPFTLARYSRACSSDQKKTDLRQKTSVMLGSFSASKLTSGAKTSGCAPGSTDLIAKSLSISRRNGWWQCAHSVSMRADKCSLRSCPCTKGVAIASIPQAAKVCSPVLSVTRCGVSATVTGYAHTTAPAAFLNRNVRCFSRSSSRATTCSIGKFNSRAIQSGVIGLPTRGNSRTTRLRTR